MLRRNAGLSGRVRHGIGVARSWSAIAGGSQRRNDRNMSGTSTERSAARITTPFGFESTATDVVDGIDLSGARAIVTGASSGIGLETARALARAGAAVTLAVGNRRAGATAVADIVATTGNVHVRFVRLDLGERSSIAAFVSGWDGPLEILVDTAEVVTLPQLERTSEGWEMQFAINHLGHFALAVGLHDALRAAGSARIVSVSSSAHLRSPVVFDDIQFASRAYEPLLAYGQSKTANVLFAVGATKQWADDGITANALLPGAIATDFQRCIGLDFVARTRAKGDGAGRIKTAEQGAATSVLLATSPRLEGIGGRCFEDGNEAELVTEHGSGSGGVAPYALDPDNADRLWETSLRLVGDAVPRPR
jgi:NAD(P)-dependent dehydrogenase (short-subunit alcohol dehydrogenase family)